MILIHTLARIDEILRLTWADVNFEKRTITLWSRKNQAGEWKSRTLGMNEDLQTMLYSMWTRRKQEKWVFWNSREKGRYLRRPKFMHSICKRAGIEPIGKTSRIVWKWKDGIRTKVREDQDVYYGFHAIRHFVATYLHDILKVPTGVLSGVLGHESKRTTEIYLHSVDEAAREALTRLEGIFSVAVLPEKGRK